MNYEEQQLLNETQETQNLENDGLSLQELQGFIGSQIRDSVNYIDDSISPNRAQATKYYRGEPFGNEEDGRSSVVDMTVQGYCWKNYACSFAGLFWPGQGL